MSKSEQVRERLATYLTVQTGGMNPTSNDPWPEWAVNEAAEEIARLFVSTLGIDSEDVRWLRAVGAAKKASGTRCTHMADALSALLDLAEGGEG